MERTSLRTYGGVAGADRQAGRHARFLEAGLELLGAAEGDRGLSVRGVCRQAGLATRYFYENFADRDALVAAVYDDVVATIAERTLESVRAAEGAEAKVRAGLGTLVRRIAEDPRRGHLLFSPALDDAVVARRRVASTRLFVRLLVGQAREFYGLTDPDPTDPDPTDPDPVDPDPTGPAGDTEPADATALDLTAELLVGGLAQVLSSWLTGALAVTEEEVVDRCTTLFVRVANAD
ncbi:TetR/AcrR family transcriptional regulator [Saccharomonospora halophila]|uniref:TetR/AcrR family transcriptional regulator n=1 Tax=Saccharomonospora halophila TaxID=129922 RepID=UPI000373DADD|nr:TetR/AcrR family transcriptional regulator [Saccharomonospora halophila]